MCSPVISTAGSCPVSRSETFQSRAPTTASCESSDEVAGRERLKYFPETPSTSRDAARYSSCLLYTSDAADE